MKELTIAYNINDHHTLLSLVIGWMNRSENGIASRLIKDDDQLKIYNPIRIDQVATLEESLAGVMHRPKYLPIVQCIHDFPFHPLAVMEIELRKAETA